MTKNEDHLARKNKSKTEVDDQESNAKVTYGTLLTSLWINYR